MITKVRQTIALLRRLDQYGVRDDVTTGAALAVVCIEEMEAEIERQRLELAQCRRLLACCVLRTTMITYDAGRRATELSPQTVTDSRQHNAHVMDWLIAESRRCGDGFRSRIRRMQTLDPDDWHAVMRYGVPA